MRHRHGRDTLARGVRRRSVGAVGLEWREHVDIDPALFCPTDIEGNYANAEKAERRARLARDDRDGRCGAPDGLRGAGAARAAPADRRVYSAVLAKR